MYFSSLQLACPIRIKVVRSNEWVLDLKKEPTLTANCMELSPTCIVGHTQKRNRSEQIKKSSWEFDIHIDCEQPLVFLISQSRACAHCEGRAAKPRGTRAPA